MINNDETSLLTLHALVRIGRDAERGYLAAADLVADPELIQLFADKAVQRARFVAELQDRIRTLRGDPSRDDKGSAAGDLHQVWMGLRGLTENAEAHAVLSEVERGEDVAVQAYRDALAERELDKQTREIIQRQYEFVQAAHDRVRQLRDSAAYAHR
jgi:uncharacterized protein (TIGR02284 family)